MKSKGILSLLLAFASCISLVGCGSQDEIAQLNSLSALNSESNVSGDYNLSYSDEQEMIYAQVSNRQLLDLSTLDACTDNEIQQVVNYMNGVDNQLVGKVYTASYDSIITKYFISDMINDDAVIDSSFTDYLLTFMEQTPYYWQRTKTIVRGIDSSSRSIIVDVTYKTIGYNKAVKEDSTIVKGSPDYTTLLANRYNKYIDILDTKTDNPNDENLPKMISDFKKYYGEPADIIAEQQEYTPTTSIYMTGNQTTYNGLVDSAAEKSGGTLTVRYVLVPNYVLGINLGITCQHMYITEFSLDNDCTADLSTFTEEGYATVTDSIYSLIYSYFTCIDESDFEGLYKLTNNFQSLDKHYQDVFDSTYQKHDGFSVSLFNITGTHITCGVTISSKERAKGSEMTFPVYTDRYYMELELVGDTLKVNNMVLLSRRIEGEPAITTDEADTNGFSAQIDLDNDDKVAIEKLICDFSSIQLLGDYSSDAFSDIVDISISTNQLASLQSNMTSLTGSKKVVFLKNYQQGTSNYASVRCKELFQDESNSIVEAESTYEFILKGNKWYIYNYDVNSSIKLDTTNLSTTGSLCLVSPGKVEAYTSQIKSSASTNLDDVSDTSVTFDHKEYNPTDKDAVVEQGYNKLTGADVTEEIFNSVVQSEDYNAFNERVQTFATLFDSNGEDYATAYKGYVFDAVAVAYNDANGRYLDSERSEALASACSLINSNLDSMKSLESMIPSTEHNYFEDCRGILSSLLLKLEE